MSPGPETAVVLAGGFATFHGFALASCPRIFLPPANRLLPRQGRRGSLRRDCKILVKTMQKAVRDLFRFETK
jgi:hypothetical protein